MFFGGEEVDGVLLAKKVYKAHSIRINLLKMILSVKGFVVHQKLLA